MEAQIRDFCNIKIPKNALTLLQTLENAGYESWFVGGFVRDAVLGHQTNDIDIATKATCQQVKQVCNSNNMRVFNTGIKHGTVTVVVNPPLSQCDRDTIPNVENAHTTFEVTTFRKDGSYSDNRHPNNIEVVNTIQEDLMRRDFTINAMAWHPKRGLFDPFDGMQDIRNRTIRCVGDAQRRFNEDALRILRACRFCAQLGFDIEPQTFHACISMKKLLESLSYERITQEMNKFVCGDYIHDALMLCFPIIVWIVPEISAMKDFDQKTPYHIYDVLEHTAYTMQNSPKDLLLRWVALFHDSGKPAAFFTDSKGIGHFYGHATISAKLARSAFQRLRFSQSFIEDAIKLIKLHDLEVSPTKKCVRRAILNFEGDVNKTKQFLDLQQADASAHAKFCQDNRYKRIDNVGKILDEIINDNEIFSVAKLEINGNNLIELGVAEGPRIGIILKKILEQVVEGKLPNDLDSQIEYVKTLL